MTWSYDRHPSLAPVLGSHAFLRAMRSTRYFCRPVAYSI